MRIAKYRDMIVVLLMMAFIGQVVASTTVSCQSQSASPQSHEQIIDSGMMDHSQHMKSLITSYAGDTTGSVCCPDCDCSLGGCSTAAVLPSSQHPFTSDIASLIIYYNELADGQLTVSLFRPPISR
jgi:hypothetical protein